MLNCTRMRDESGDRRHFCPNCGSYLVRRSFRAGFVEKVFYRLIGLRPYRCRGCETRFFDRGGGKGRVDAAEDEK